MQRDIELNGKPLRVTLSKAAELQLADRQQPLQVEMELYFSCLIRKQVLFRDGPAEPETVMVSDRLAVRFHPVMSQGCSVDQHLDGPPVTDFPIVRQSRFSPRWLIIDWRDGQWHGDFGY